MAFGPGARLEVRREQILAYRRQAGALDERHPAGAEGLRRAAWAGLQDSMPRAALLSIHARVAGAGPDTWKDPSLVQIWGPRFSVFVIAVEDVPIFSLGTLSDTDKGRRRADDLADRLEAAVGQGKPVPYGAMKAELGLRHANELRYAAATGRVLLRWEGARQPTVWTVPAPQIGPDEARLELARRYLHIYGPTTAAAFGVWAGIGPRPAQLAFERLSQWLVPVMTPIGEAEVLASDEELLRCPPDRRAKARLLPSGDSFFLLQGADRKLLVPDRAQRETLWTSRVWPGALLVDGEPAGTWRRADNVLLVSPWRQLSEAERSAVVAEAEGLPLPLNRLMSVRWADL